MKFWRRLLAVSLIIALLVVLLVIHKQQPVSQVLITPAPSSQTSSYTFAVISDIHSDHANLERALSRAKVDGSELVIVVGDLTKAGGTKELEEVKTILDKSGILYYVVPGNHDLKSVKGEVNPFRSVFGHDFQSFQKGEVKFILVNNADGNLGVADIIGLSGQNQGQWLRGELVDCPKLYCLVFMHMPLNNTISGHVMGEESAAVASEAAGLVQQLVDFKVKEVFSGHIHYLSTYTLDGLKTTTDGAIIDTPRFIEVTVQGPVVILEEKQVWLD